MAHARHHGIGQAGSMATVVPFSGKRRMDGFALVPMIAPTRLRLQERGTRQSRDKLKPYNNTAAHEGFDFRIFSADLAIFEARSYVAQAGGHGRAFELRDAFGWRAKIGLQDSITSISKLMEMVTEMTTMKDGTDYDDVVMVMVTTITMAMVTTTIMVRMMVVVVVVVRMMVVVVVVVRMMVVVVVVVMMMMVVAVVVVMMMMVVVVVVMMMMVAVVVVPMTMVVMVMVAAMMMVVVVATAQTL